MRDRLNELQRIAQSLMSRGGVLDRSPVAEQRAALEALQLLGSLAETTKSSLPASTPAQAAAAPKPAPAVAPAPASAAARTAAHPQSGAKRPPAAAPAASRAGNAPYDSRKQEYRPALKNQDLVGALLEYYQRSRGHRPASRNLIKADQQGHYENGLFESPTIPHVDVRPKDGLMPRRAPEVSAQPILRPSRYTGDEN